MPRLLLLLLCTIAAALGCVLPKTLRRSPTRLGLELDPVLASALATCVVRAPSTATLVRSLASRRGPASVSKWGLGGMLSSVSKRGLGGVLAKCGLGGMLAKCGLGRMLSSVSKRGLGGIPAKWACVDELSFPKLVADSVSTQGVEWLLDTLSTWTRHF